MDESTIIESEFYIITGLQGGDEGKGKVTNKINDDAIKKFGAENVYVIGVNGGSNAGHTTSIDGIEYHTHFLPTGAVENGVRMVCGSNKVLEPISLRKELFDLSKTFPGIPDRLVLSERIHYTTIGHLIIDAGKVGKSIGTTSKGIGPTYASKASRTGIRLADLVKMTEDEIKEKLYALYEYMGLLAYPKDEIIYSYEDIDDMGNIYIVNVNYDSLFSFENDIKNIKWFLETFGRSIVSALYFKHEFLTYIGKCYIFELSNAMLLDITHGTYPNVTSSSCVSSVILESMGLNFSDIKLMKNMKIIGVVKSYPTRVGCGTLVTGLSELSDTAETIVSNGSEFGTTTGRKRRPGWLDLFQLKYAIDINGTTDINITRLDNLSHFDSIDICVGYRFPDGRTIFAESSDCYDYPATEKELSSVVPIYVTIDGWKGFDFSTVRSYDDLHENVKRYIQIIEDKLGVKISYINTGKDKDKMITKFC